VDETEDVLCLWRADFDGDENTMRYGMDIFSRGASCGAGTCEEHVEYAHSPEFLKDIMEKAGFESVTALRLPPERGRQTFYHSETR
jgi:predicted TPR repeat methyltransferase